MTAASATRYRSILLVEPDAEARRALAPLLEPDFSRVHTAATAGEAMRQLGRSLDLVLLNVELPDAPALDVLQAAFAQRVPPVVAITGRPPEPSVLFELARAGARAYLEQPLDPSRLWACLEPGSAQAELQRLIRPLLGRFGLKEIQALVRQALLSEALQRSGGSRRSAAQLLCVTRPAIQKWLRAGNLPES